MEGFKKWMEMSYTQADIPRYFYVCPKFNPEQLANRKLVGLTGISENWIQVMEFFWIDCLLQMDGPKTTELNNLTRILYKPEYLASRNFAAAKRITADKDIKDWIEEVMDFIKEKLRIADDATEFINLYTNQIKDLNQMTTLIQDWINKRGHNIDWKTTRKYVNQGMYNMAKPLESEKEWNTKSQWERTKNGVQQINQLIIPQGSKLYIKPKPFYVEKAEEYNLEMIYHVIWVRGREHAEEFLQQTDTKNVV